MDSVYWKRFGRRKSWIVPTQIAVGLFLLWIGTMIDGVLESPTVNVTFITFLFLGMVLLAATQDIAVDGILFVLLYLSC